MPSARKDSTNWRRFAPTARAMPISGFRSAASITKMRKISRMPAAMLNSPNTTNTVVNAAPISSANFTRSRLSGEIS